MHLGAHQKDRGDDHECERHPSPRHQCIEISVAEEEVLDCGGVRTAGVECGENLRAQHEQVDENGDSHDGDQCLNGTGTNPHLAHAADQLQHYDDECRSRDESRS